jgi:hypothetical protein
VPPGIRTFLSSLGESGFFGVLLSGCANGKPARECMSKGRDSGRDLARLEALLSEAGLTMPPMPADAESRLKEREEWCFSTRGFKVSPFDLLHHVRKAIGDASPDYVLVARAGSGPNREAMHYFLVQGPLQVFLQVGWGKTSNEQDRATKLTSECFALAHDLVAAVPQTLRRGRLSREGRLTVVGSDLGESFWEVAQSDERGSQPGGHPRGRGRNLRSPLEVLTEALGWCREKE